MATKTNTELVVLLLVLVLGLVATTTQAQSCGAQLSGLAPCARYSVPPVPGQPLPAPGQDCCSALGAVTRDCACGALDIITSLPTKCGLPRVTCPRKVKGYIECEGKKNKMVLVRIEATVKLP